MRRSTVAIVFALCLPLTGCYDEPVSEHVHLVVSGVGPAVVTVVQEVAPPDRAQQNPQLADRLESSREEIGSGLDRWSQRFNLLDKTAEHLSSEHIHGGLRRSVHTAVVPSFENLLPLLEADGLTGGLTTGGGVAELTLIPSGGSRATYLQRQAAERRLADWSSVLASYFDALIELYEYLDQQPHRATPCFAHVFEDHEGLGPTGPLTDLESVLVTAVKESLEEVAEALTEPKDETFSLNSLTRLVYDPFPARLTVVVKGGILESEGFFEAGNFFERRPVDAWSALEGLAGRWASPDLVTAAFAPVPADELPEVDVNLMVQLPRRYQSPPSAGEVETALLTGLVPEELLLIRWRPLNSPASGSSDGEPNWIAVMTEAEASVPD